MFKEMHDTLVTPRVQPLVYNTHKIHESFYGQVIIAGLHGDIIEFYMPNRFVSI